MKLSRRTCTRYRRCWTTAVAFAFATTFRLASSRICLAVDCRSASSPWSDGRFDPSFTVFDWDFAAGGGGGPANLRARSASFFLCSISSADCVGGGPGGLGWPALLTAGGGLFLWNKSTGFPLFFTDKKIQDFSRTYMKNFPRPFRSPWMLKYTENRHLLKIFRVQSIAEKFINIPHCIQASKSQHKLAAILLLLVFHLNH